MRCSCCGSPWRPLLLGLLLLLRPGRRRGRIRRAGQPAPERAGCWSTALGLGAIGYATQATFYFSALQRIDASLVALVLYTYPAAGHRGRRSARPRAADTGRGAPRWSSPPAGRCSSCSAPAGVSFDPVGVGPGLRCRRHLHRLHPRRRHRRAPAVPGGAGGVGDDRRRGDARRPRRASTGGDRPRLRAGRVVLDRLHRRRVHRPGDARPSSPACAGPARRPRPSCRPSNPSSPPRWPRSRSNEFLTPVQLAGGLVVLSSVAVLQLRPQRRRATWSTERDELPTPEQHRSGIVS